MGGLPSYLAGEGAVAALLLKATLLLALAWAAHMTLRRANPRWRVLLWRGAAVGLAALPLLMLVLPAVRIDVAPGPLSALMARAPSGAVPAATEVARAAWRFERARPWLPAALWAAGFVLMVARTLIGHRRVGRLVRSSRPLPEGTVQALRAIAEALGCGGAVEFRMVSGLGSPLLTGLRRPVVLLPAAILRGAERRDIEGIVAHELAHLRSHDLAWAYGLHWLSAALWFHPLAWGMGRAHAQACELVSDAVSAGHVGSGGAYARALARVAVRMWPLQPALAVLPLAGRSELGARLAALRRGVTARKLPLIWAIAACLAATCITLLLSALVFGRAWAGGEVTTEYGVVSRAVARALDQNVTLVPPYPASHQGGRRDMISVQYAVIVLGDQVGLGFQWGESYPGAYPASAALIRPDIRGLPWREAMQRVVEPVGLRFGIRDGEVVLRPALAAGDAQPAMGDGQRASPYP